MSRAPGTVSKILWHFTGGPLWDEQRNKQGKELKPEEGAFDALRSIIATKELRVGAYQELFKVVIPKKRKYDIKSKEFITETNVPVVVKSSKVCCIADIPIQHLSYHSTRYGRIAIGFYRDAVVKAGFNPVMYSLEHSHLSNAIYDGYSALDDIDPFWAKMYLDDLTEQADIDDVASQLDEIDWGHDQVRESYEKFLAFIKTFEPDEFDSIYCEREWRSTLPFRFAVEDIAMIVLPRNSKGRNLYEEYLSETDLPRTVSIVCWEDLIEH